MTKTSETSAPVRTEMHVAFVASTWRATDPRFKGLDMGLKINRLIGMTILDNDHRVL